MGSFGLQEMLVVFLIVLILFGARRIPEIAGSFGKGIREFKRSLNDVERSIREPDPPPAERLRTSEPVAQTRAPDDDNRPEPKRLMS